MTQIPATLDLNFHTVPDRWAVSQSLGGLGASLEWWLNQAWDDPDKQRTRQEKFSAMNAELAATGPSDGLFFIPLTGGHDDPATTRSGGFVGLRLGHNRADMARAIMESAAFELRWALEAVMKAGMPVDALSMVGGAAHSPHWPGILANTTAVPIHLPQYDNWPALGASILAGLGAGLFETISDALSQFQKSVHKIAPNPLGTVSYDQSFERYQKLYPTVQTQNRSSTERNQT
jgi:xylulokinase